MDPVTLAFVAASAAATFAIAAVAVGREARRLDAVAPRAVYDPDEAASFVADRLPPSTQSRLTPAELDSLLRLHLRWMHDHGLQPRDVVDRRQDIVDRVVAAEEVLVAHLLGGAAAAGVEVLDDVDVLHVVRAHLAYFEAIGAVGPSASDMAS
ncbi:MAG: hypothetical protein EBU70_07060 [Actinobacteria bacterium]|nr:hypothetical protein [Actinomycetota bacterium]